MTGNARALPAAEQRRLAAILIADVAGYTRMMERDDAGTLARLQEIRRDVIEPALSRSAGRVVKTAGDGFLAEFGSAIAALQAALEIQRAMAERNFGLATDERIDYRIGINLGDILVDGEDIAGDGVNVASRLESLADPGGICVSASVREQVHRDLGAGFVDIGEQRVKNLARPVRVFKVALDGSDGAARRTGEAKGRWRRHWRVIVGAAAVLAVAVGAVWVAPRVLAPAPDVPSLSLAVLPFAAGSEAADRALADLLTADVAMQVERVAHSFRIVPSASAAMYQGERADLRAATKSLRARYLVVGDVRRSGGQRVVVVQLVDGVQDRHVWSDRLELQSAVATADEQRKLASQLAHRVRLAVYDAEIKRVRNALSAAGGAVEMVLRGDGAWDDYPDNVQGAREARKLYDQALRLDPKSVPALIGRAFTLQVELGFDPAADRARLLPLLEDAANRAFALDNGDAMAWRLRGNVFQWQGRWDAALEAFGRAEQIDPNRAGLVVEHAYALMWMGRPTDAIVLAQRATDLDTAQALAGPILRMRCRCNIMLGRIDEAIADCDRALASEDTWPTHAYLVAAYALQGNLARVETEKLALFKMWPDATVEKFVAVGKRFTNEPAFWEASERTLLAGLRKAGLRER